MVITHKLKMNLEEEVTQRLEMPLGDASTRCIELLLYLRQSPWTVPDGVAVLIQYQKPDGTMGEYDTMPDGTAAWCAVDNSLTISVAPQVLTAAGNVILYASLYLEEKVLHTFAVEISVKAPSGKGRSTASRDYYYAANVLRGPVMAQAGQLLAVEEVDAQGRVTKVEAMDAAGVVNKNGNAVLYTHQNLSLEEKEQARANINAASKAVMDFLAGRLEDDCVILPDYKSGERHALYTRKDKLMLTIRGQQGRDVTILTNEDEKALVSAVIAALPVYNGEVEEV